MSRLATAVSSAVAVLVGVVGCTPVEATLDDGVVDGPNKPEQISKRSNAPDELVLKRWPAHAHGRTAHWVLIRSDGTIHHADHPGQIGRVPPRRFEQLVELARANTFFEGPRRYPDYGRLNDAHTLVSIVVDGRRRSVQGPWWVADAPEFRFNGPAELGRVADAAEALLPEATWTPVEPAADFTCDLLNHAIALKCPELKQTPIQKPPCDYWAHVLSSMLIQPRPDECAAFLPAILPG